MLAFLVVVERIIPLAMGIMKAVEKIFTAIKNKDEKNGQAKKEAYIDGLMSALGVTELALQKDLVNDEKFKHLMGKFADAVIEVNNFIRDFPKKEK